MTDNMTLESRVVGATALESMEAAIAVLTPTRTIASFIMDVDMVGFVVVSWLWVENCEVVDLVAGDGGI
jgi:hypothetical protein